MRTLLGQTLLPAPVPLRQQLPHEDRVRRAAGEVAAAPQQQRLAQRTLEPVVALLRVTVLVRLAGLDRLAPQPVMPQQRLIARGELFRVRHLLHGSTEPVGAVFGRHAPQFLQGILQPFPQALEALGEAERATLPIRVGEHEVVDQVREADPGDGHV